MDFSEAIERARGSGESARAAVEQLTAASTAALPEIIEAMASPWGDHGMLPSALEQIYRAAPSESLLQAVEESFPVFECAMRAAEMRPDSMIKEVLLEKLQDSELPPGRRAEIAAFFGNLGDVSVTPRLQSVFDSSSKLERAADNVPRLAIEAAVGLAKLGTFQAGSYLVDLLSDEYSPTRSLAAKALQIAVGPDMTQALAEAARDPATEVRLPAIEALFLLRSPGAVDALLEATKSGDPAVANNARIGVNDIIGSEFSATSAYELMANHWSDVKQDWRSNSCYRLGQPFSVKRLFEILNSLENRRREILTELTLTTGIRPSDGHYSPQVAAEVSQRLNETGVLYRWGHKVDVS